MSSNAGSPSTRTPTLDAVLKRGAELREEVERRTEAKAASSANSSVACRREAAREVLTESRDMGGPGLQLAPSWLTRLGANADRLRREVEQNAATCYPREWVERSNEGKRWALYGPRTAGLVLVLEGATAFFAIVLLVYLSMQILCAAGLLGVGCGTWAVGFSLEFALILVLVAAAVMALGSRSNSGMYIPFWHRYALNLPEPDARVRKSGDPKGLSALIVHELGHRMEHVVPGLIALESEYYERRRGGGKRPDFAISYANSTPSPVGKMYEVFTTGYEALFFGYEGTNGQSEQADEEHLDFVLGVAALL